MDIEKINDFIEAYSRAIQLSPEYTEVLKELLPKIIKKLFIKNIDIKLLK